MNSSTALRKGSGDAEVGDYGVLIPYRSVLSCHWDCVIYCIGLDMKHDIARNLLLHTVKLFAQYLDLDLDPRLWLL